MARRRVPIRELQSWAVYHIKGTPAKLVGFIDAPDEQTAIKTVIKEYKVPRSERVARHRLFLLTLEPPPISGAQ
jgi:hypothetical protein